MLCAAAIPAAARTDAADCLTVPMPERWAAAPANETTLPSDDAWWRGFDDPTLDSLITIGENNNFDIAMAARRLDAARQAVRSARAGYFPTVNATAGWSRQREAGMIDGGSPTSSAKSPPACAEAVAPPTHPVPTTPLP